MGVWNGVRSASWVQLRSYLEEKIAAPVYKTENMAVGIRCADQATPLYPLQLALTLPTSGGRSVGIVRSQTLATECSYDSPVQLPPTASLLCSFTNRCSRGWPFPFLNRDSSVGIAIACGLEFLRVGSHTTPGREMTTHLHLVTRWRIVELNLHSPIRFHAICRTERIDNITFTWLSFVS
jgi:hypothetical protein